MLILEFTVAGQCRNLTELRNRDKRFILFSKELFSIFSPSISIDPASDFNIPVMHFMVVVLPAPLGPRNPNICPFSTLKLNLSRAFMVLITLPKLRIR